MYPHTNSIVDKKDGEDTIDEKEEESFEGQCL